MKPLKLLLLALLALSLLACDRAPRHSKFSQLPKQHDYDDCILQYMENVSSDRAARAIQKACRAQSALMVNQDPALPADAVARLNGNASTVGEHLSGRIYNGNSDWIITQLTILHTPDEAKDSGYTPVPLKYVANVNINPLTIEDFSLQVLNKQPNYSWHIVSARGIKMPEPGA